MALSFAKAGASAIAIGARSGLESVKEDLKGAAGKAGRKEPQVLCLQMDILDESSVANAARQIEAEFGRLDVLINNAAIIGKMKPIADSETDVWWETC
jgi:NAD(P)-dependent dehydrogenase (short-subunit alcohol dehydrogenase family)